jgi:DNA-binding Lrp family transcriptional regulator
VGQIEACRGIAVLTHGEPLVLGRQLAGDQRPEGVLLGRVLDIGDRIPGVVRSTDGRDGVPAGPVGGVREPGVVSRQLDRTGRTRERRSVRRHNFSQPSRGVIIQQDCAIRDGSTADQRYVSRTSDYDRVMAHDVQLDAVDHAVLEALARDGRMSMNELATQVGVSRATAYSRVERLRREQVITGFTATIDPARAGFGVTALILLNVRQADWQAARDLLLAVPGVVYLAMTSGAFDMVMLVRAADVHHLRDVVLGELHDVPQVRSTQTVFVLEEHGPLPLPRTQER